MILLKIKCANVCVINIANWNSGGETIIYDTSYFLENCAPHVKCVATGNIEK